MTRFYLPEVHRYCMAPRLVESETGVVVVYSRGRILKLHGEEGQGQLAYVHFIDHGFGNWVYVAALATLPYGMCAIPWQAIPVALMGARPQGSFLKPVSVSGLYKACFYLYFRRRISGLTNTVNSSMKFSGASTSSLSNRCSTKAIN